MTLQFFAVSGIGEVRTGDVIAQIIVDNLDEPLLDGDVVVVTSKIVSKAAGLATTVPKEELLHSQTDRVVAQRGETRIVRTHHGLTMAAAGIDNSNTTPGTLIPLPPDADGSAAEIRARLRELTGRQIAVVISDTAGRAWRIGQTDIAIGCAGILPFDSFAGRTDPYGNHLAATSPAIVDQIAGAAELASGKFGARPVVIVRGTDPIWHTVDDGPGARVLIRAEDGDMFGLGAREAAVSAILGDQPVRGLPRDESVSIDIIIDLGLRGLSFQRTDVSIGTGALVLSVSPGNEFIAGILAQRLMSLGIAHGVSVAIRIESTDEK